jgi:hypothetical protein
MFYRKEEQKKKIPSLLLLLLTYKLQDMSLPYVYLKYSKLQNIQANDGE